jgi:hypothetical protein
MRSLVPCVDQIRDLYTCLGTRSYKVSLVRTRWSGGERGAGVEVVTDVRLLLPTPRIADLTALEQDLRAAGTVEDGTLKVDQISARFTEDMLLGLGDGGATIPADENFYWEITVLFPDGSERKRRFVPKSAPNLNMMNVQWSIELDKAVEDRGRNGDPR